MPWDFFLGKNVDTPTDRDTFLLVNCAFFSQLIIQPTLLKISCQVKISSQDSEYKNQSSQGLQITCKYVNIVGD